MESKMPVFISVVIIFTPLLLLADNTALYLIISFIILFILSLENILISVKTKTGLDQAALKSEFENIASYNFSRLQLGFKTAKSIFTATFVVSILVIFDHNLPIIALSVPVLFLSAVELKKYSKPYSRPFYLVMGIINMSYLAVVAAANFSG